jgi:long-chain acyl-CoA synthetase
MYTHTYQVVQRRAAAHPESTALGAQVGLGWETYTSRELLERTDRLAAELAADGLSSGDRVVLWVPNRHWTAAYLFACWKLGAVVVPFDREMNPEAAADIIDSVEPRLTIVGYGERPAWARDRAIVEWWEPGARGLDPATVTAVAPDPATLAAIFFTSGTTGKPKGCMITHGNFCHQIEALPSVIPLDTSNRLASILPLSHLFEMTCGLLYPLSCGSAIHYIPSRRAPDILRVLNEQKITSMIAVPQLLTMVGTSIDAQLRSQLPTPVYRSMMAAADRLPRPARRALFTPVHKKLGGHLTIFGSGGAALPLETLHLWERFGVQVAQGFGASECSPVITSTSIGGNEPAGSCGKPLPGVEVRLTPEGEACVRGPNVMQGYWKDPVRTAEALIDGWYHTGDLATIDAGGNLFVTGRAKDLIVLPSGLKVWPTDVEDVLCEHPLVKDAAVLMVPTAGGGATLHAYLIATPGHEGAEINHIIAESNGRLAQHQRVATASWWHQPDFPRTSTLKLRRNLLPQPSATTAVKVESFQAADDPVGLAVAGVAKLDAVRDEQTLAELGLDSLGLVDLALALEEKTGRQVGDGDLKLDMSVAGVRAFVASAPALADGDGHGPARNAQGVMVEQPLWPYTTGRHFRFVGAPFDGLYRASVTHTVVEGGEHLVDLPQRLIFAGTHRSFADFPLVRYGLKKTPARRLADRLVVAAWAGGFDLAGALGNYAKVAFGVYPLHQDANRDASLRGLVRLAEAGNPILIFPQGYHATVEQELAEDPVSRFKPGIAHLAQTLDAAVIPFGLAGTERLVPPDADTYHGLKIAGIPVKITRGPAAIVFGPLVRPEATETPAAFAARLQSVVFPLARRAEAALEALAAPAAAGGVSRES